MGLATDVGASAGWDADAGRSAGFERGFPRDGWDAGRRYGSNVRTLRPGGRMLALLMGLHSIIMNCVTLMGLYSIIMNRVTILKALEYIKVIELLILLFFGLNF